MRSNAQGRKLSSFLKLAFSLVQQTHGFIYDSQVQMGIRIIGCLLRAAWKKALARG